MRVLLVEDDVRMAAAMHRALRPAGVIADVAATSEDAVWMVREASYDAMVLDVMLPDLDGFETCRRLRTDGVWVRSVSDKVFAPGYSEFDTSSGGDVEALALALPTDQINEAVPAALRLISTSAWGDPRERPPR